MRAPVTPGKLMSPTGRGEPGGGVGAVGGTFRILLEAGGYLLQEVGDFLLLESSTTSRLLMESGDNLLLESGSYILKEN